MWSIEVMISQAGSKDPGTIMLFRIHCTRGEHLRSETSGVWKGRLFCVFNWQWTIFKCPSYLLTLNDGNKRENMIYSFKRVGHFSKIFLFSWSKNKPVSFFTSSLSQSHQWLTFLMVQVYPCVEVQSSECVLKLFEIQRSSSLCCLP